MAALPTTNPEPLDATRGRLILPFVNTQPLLDVVLLLVLLPVWWALGVDQFIWMAGGVWAALKMSVLKQGRIRLPATLILLACFLGAQLISALFIVEPTRYITFARTFGAYVAAFCIALVLVNEVQSVRQIKLVLRTLIGVMALMAVLGFLAEIRVFRPVYTAPFALVLPASLKNTDYGTFLTLRHMGNSTWFSLFGNYYRLSVFFLYPTGYAPALMFTIPLALFAFWRANRFAKLFWIGLLALLGFNLAFTTGRVAIVALILGGAYFAWTAWSASRWRAISHLLVVTIAVAFAIGLIGWVVGEGQLPSAIPTLYEDFVLARGAGSLNDRTDIYTATIENAVERPVFGWGTERDLPTLTLYPAGSHDYYLAVIYKYGIVGLMIFAALWIILWRETRPPSSGANSPESRYLARLLRYGRWVIVGTLVNGLAEVLDLDTTVLVFLWIIIALLICARRQYNLIWAIEHTT